MVALGCWNLSFLRISMRFSSLLLFINNTDNNLYNSDKFCLV